MTRTLLVPLALAAVLVAAPARAADDVPPGIHAGYAVGAILLVTAVGTGAVAVSQWSGLINTQNTMYAGGHFQAELDLLIEDGSGYVLRGIVFTSIAGVALVSGIITLASTSDRHDQWKAAHAGALLHRRRPRLASVSAAPDPRGGLYAGMEVRW